MSGRDGIRYFVDSSLLDFHLTSDQFSLHLSGERDGTELKLKGSIGAENKELAAFTAEVKKGRSFLGLGGSLETKITVAMADILKGGSFVIEDKLKSGKETLRLTVQSGEKAVFTATCEIRAKKSEPVSTLDFNDDSVKVSGKNWKESWDMEKLKKRLRDSGLSDVSFLDEILNEG
jgi:hypothetical protein